MRKLDRYLDKKEKGNEKTDDIRIRKKYIDRQIFR